MMWSGTTRLIKIERKVPQKEYRIDERGSFISLLLHILCAVSVESLFFLSVVGYIRFLT